MKHLRRHVRFPGLAALLVTLTAVAASPGLADVIGQRWASAIIILSSVAQALTKPVKRERPPVPTGIPPKDTL